jgi:hypothetical protein
MPSARRSSPPCARVRRSGCASRDGAARWPRPCDALAKDGIATSPTEACGTALRITEGGRRLRNAPAYADGRVELQDLSAQRAVAFGRLAGRGAYPRLLRGRRRQGAGHRRPDRCRGFAHDAEPRRMADLPVRAARAGVTIRIGPARGYRAPRPVRRGAVRRALQRQRHMAARSRGEVAADARSGCATCGAGRRRSSMPPRRLSVPAAASST